MKKFGTIGAAVFLAGVLVFYMCTFQVRFTEVAIKKTWGSPDPDAIEDPALYFKWPAPIQSAVIYDKRTRLLEDRTEETRTVDGKNLLLTTFTLWKIKDPSKFHTNFPAGVEDGERKLRTTIVTHKHAVTGQREFGEFVSTNPADRKLRQIETEMKESIAKDALDQYGIEVVDFGIKKLALPESVTASIFDAMKKAEETKAGSYIAQGDASAQSIIAEAKAVEERILGAARKKVAEIERDAERVVSEYYKEFNRHPELRIFLDSLRTLSEALRMRTTIILNTDNPPWNLFDDAVRARVPVPQGIADQPVEPVSDRPKTN